ncbi:hypothetical protein DPMN_111777 [Dreissena polymorpha]|uniref:Uncharacterized protein n=1 Tax=Dreissena polymorpha TaxID=45954 RepID=A0A9D4KF46_DREPO|nr:hypothetical protein DPMN_111777 [Dreissena polymorpha]
MSSLGTGIYKNTYRGEFTWEQGSTRILSAKTSLGLGSKKQHTKILRLGLKTGIYTITQHNDFYWTLNLKSRNKKTS